MHFPLNVVRDQDIRLRARASVFCRLVVALALFLVVVMAVRTALAVERLTSPPAASVASPRATHLPPRTAVEADRAPTGEAR